MLSQGGIARQVAKPKPVAAPPAAVAKAPAKVAAPATKAAGVAPSASSGELKSLQEENQRLQGQVREQGSGLGTGVCIKVWLSPSDCGVRSHCSKLGNRERLLLWKVARYRSCLSAERG